MNANNWASTLDQVTGLVNQATAAYGQWQGDFNAKKTESLMKKQAELQYKYQQMASEEEMRRAKELWNMTNEYNSPSAVRARLEQAGMLGASMFEGASPGIPAQNPDVSTPSGPNVSIPGSDQLMPGLAASRTFTDNMMRIAQIRNTEANTSLQQAQTGETVANTSLIEANDRFTSIRSIGQSLTNDMQTIQNAVASATKDFNIESSRLAVEQSKASLGSMVQTIQNQIRDGMLKDVELEQANLGLIETTINIALLDVQTQLARANIRMTEEQVSYWRQLYLNAAKEGVLFENQIYRENIYTYGESRGASGRPNIWIGGSPFLNEQSAKKSFTYDNEKNRSEILRKQNNWYNTVQTFDLVNQTAGTVVDGVSAFYGIGGVRSAFNTRRAVGF